MKHDYPAVKKTFLVLYFTNWFEKSFFPSRKSLFRKIVTFKTFRLSKNNSKSSTSIIPSLFKKADESEFFLDKTGNSNNILFLPAFNGLGAPYWNSDIRGGFYGITQDTSIKDMTTACFLAITFQTKEIQSKV